MTSKNVIALMALFAVSACNIEKHDKSDNDVIDKFKTTWNLYEKVTHNEDGTILYNALPWGGLVGTFSEGNMPVDMSKYESITFEFSQPTTVPTQVVVSDYLKTCGRKGITSLTCYFDGQDVTSVDEIVLQASDTSTILLKDVYLLPNEATWESKNIWKGNCEFKNWANGFVIDADKFADATEGDRLEFVLNTDRSDPKVSYWLIKTIVNGTDMTLQGNENELNDYGCAYMARSANVYHIILTETDARNLSEKGMFMNGYFTTVKVCNLLHRYYDNDMSER